MGNSILVASHAPPEAVVQGGHVPAPICPRHTFARLQLCKFGKASTQSNTYALQPEYQGGSNLGEEVSSMAEGYLFGGGVPAGGGLPEHHIYVGVHCMKHLITIWHDRSCVALCDAALA